METAGDCAEAVQLKAPTENGQEDTVEGSHRGYRLHLSRLAPKTTVEELEAYFAKFGGISDAEVVACGRRYHYAFFNVESEEIARAVVDYGPHTINDRQSLVALARHRKGDKPEEARPSQTPSSPASLAEVAGALGKKIDGGDGVAQELASMEKAETAPIKEFPKQARPKRAKAKAEESLPAAKIEVAPCRGEPKRDEQARKIFIGGLSNRAREGDIVVRNGPTA